MRAPQRVTEIVVAMRNAGLSLEADYILTLVGGLAVAEYEQFIARDLIRDERRAGELLEYTRKQTQRGVLTRGLIEPYVRMTEHKRNRPELGGEGLLLRAKVMVMAPTVIETLTLREPPQPDPFPRGF